MSVGVVSCAELVPDESVVGGARVLLCVRLRFRFSGGIVDFGDVADGVREGRGKVSRRKDLQSKIGGLDEYQITALMNKELPEATK